MSDAVWIVAIILYLLINIWGTWAYIQIHRMSKSKQVDVCTANIGLVSVLLGWSALPPVNLYNVIVYNEAK